MADPPDKVEKIMSLDLTEFHRSLKTLCPDVPHGFEQTEFTFPTDNADVRIVYEPLGKATLGGLLALPRAKVTLIFGKMSEAEKRSFLTRFDRAFQRGGG